MQGLAVEDTVRIFVRTRSGVMGSIDLSWSINKELDSYISHLRLARDDPRRLEGVEVSPVVEPRLDRVRQRL